ncbi:hypothetical protein [Thermoactinomyces mirandus]|uniref:hypothetical protein n=1 Tax=Thermoactinomyces mirandus TaxID=2756294 RepID=UPI0015EF9F96|nr:hypothetical protein [Thermoactinomyces mirandus]
MIEEFLNHELFRMIINNSMSHLVVLFTFWLEQVETEYTHCKCILSLTIIDAQDDIEHVIPVFPV